MADFKVKDTIEVIAEDTYGYQPDGTRFFSNPGYPGIVEEIEGDKILVRFERLPHLRRVETLWMKKDDCVLLDTVRALGTPPKGKHIRPDDPRLDWLWADAATLAERRGTCSEYETFCDALGIPGREKSFEVTTTVNGLTGKFVVLARSQREADAKVATALAKEG